MRSSDLVRFLFALLVLLQPVAALAARIVNVQPAASRRSAPEGFSGELSGTFNWSTGNTDLTQLTASATGLYVTGHSRFYFSGRVSYGIEDGDTYVNSFFEHLRYRYRLLRSLSAETFIQHEYDEFRRLVFRGLFGLGPRFDLPVPDWMELAVGTAWMLEYERLSDDEFADAGEQVIDHRWSSFVYTSVDLDPEIHVTETFYVQPRFDRFSDYRLLNETALVLDVKKWLAVKISFTLAHDSRPPEDVDALDTSLATSLLFRI